MEIIVNIKSGQEAAALETFRYLSFIKEFEPVQEKTLLENIEDSVREINLIKKGKASGIDARELLNSL